MSEAGLEDRVYYLSYGDTYGFEVPGSPPEIDAKLGRMPTS